MDSCKIKKIKIPIYHGTLVLIQCDKLANMPKEWKPENFPLNGYEAIAYFADNKNGYRNFVIAVEQPTTPKIIVHESLHCMNKIFEHAGVYYDAQNDEHAAYFIGWMVDECHKFMEIK